jgi:hypothetical protein
MLGRWTVVYQDEWKRERQYAVKGETYHIPVYQEVSRLSNPVIMHTRFFLIRSLEIAIAEFELGEIGLNKRRHISHTFSPSVVRILSYMNVILED